MKNRENSSIKQDQNMIVKMGIGASPGVAIAHAVTFDNEEFVIKKRDIPLDRKQGELDRLDKAISVSKGEIRKLKKSSVKQIGLQAAGIFDFHISVLGDTSLLKEFRDTILKGNVTAEYAVATVLRNYIKDYQEMPEFFAERSRDIVDIERRLLRNLTGQKRQSLSHLASDVIIVAHDLTPSQTLAIDRKHVKGIAMDQGGATSHTAIVAQALGIPAVVGLEDISSIIMGVETVIIDGTQGTVVINPDQETIDQYKVKEKKQEDFIQSLDSLADLPAITRDGQEIQLTGNIEFPEECTTVIEKGGQGVGLYRTEFLFLKTNTEPTEETQYEAYKSVLHLCGNMPVTIRTLDLGADKYTQSKSRTPEPNPFLGCRSIRLCLQNLPLFKRQLRAILRAATIGNARLMFPLISNITELRQAKSIVRDVMEDLEDEGLEYCNNIPMGMMVEVPAAALQADAFAKEVDFFSLGTNDLVQYTLAVDRVNEKVASLFTAAHPAVLQLLRQVIRTGKKHKVPVSVCGEIAGDPEYTILLLGLGLKQFSCTPKAIPEIKKIIRSVTIRRAWDVARRVRDFDTVNEITGYLKKITRKVLPKVYDY